MTKEQFNSKLESIREEITSLYMDNGVQTDSDLYTRLRDAELYTFLAINRVYEYQEIDEGLDHETGI